MLYKNQNNYSLEFIDSNKNKYHKIKPNEIVVVLKERNLTKEHPRIKYYATAAALHATAAGVHEAAAHAAAAAGAEAHRRAGAGCARVAATAAAKYNEIYSKAYKEFQTTGQIKGYVCLFANNLIWLSHNDLKFLKQL